MNDVNPWTEDVQSFYDAEAAQYDNLRWRGAVGEFVHDTYERLVRDSLSRLDVETCLEVGCGTGRFTVELARRGYDILAIDISEKMLAAAKRAVASGGSAARVRFERVDIREFDGGPGKGYDLVCSFNVVNHIPDARRAISRMADAVRPGGALLIGVPSLYSAYFPYAFAVTARRRSLRRGVYTRWVSIPALTRQLRDQGFSLEDARGMFHAPPLRIRGLSPGVASCLRVASRLVERGPLRRTASTQIITFRKSS